MTGEKSEELLSEDAISNAEAAEDDKQQRAIDKAANKKTQKT